VNIAFIGAHPDDEMYGLGTLLLYRHRGDRLSLICATNGDKGMSDDPGFPHADCARIRGEEMDAVAHALGADYICLEEPDEALYDTWENRTKMIEAIRCVKPDVVFTHYPQDYNLDHTATSDLVFQATLLSQIASVPTSSPPLSRVPAIFYVDPGHGFGFEATHFVEIDDATTKEARRIMGLHKSQMEVSKRLLGKDYRDTIHERWKAAGERVGVPFAEAFRPCLASRRTPLAKLLP
jgi:LmbE family N-acetylglucosaminyl deacetylase